MKRVVVILLVVLAIIFGGNLAVATATHAATPSVSQEAAKSVTVSVMAPVIVGPKALAAPNVIGGGVIAPKVSWLGCYWSMRGDYFCYRYACTAFERIVYGCYQGWINLNRPWYA